MSRTPAPPDKGPRRPEGAPRESDRPWRTPWNPVRGLCSLPHRGCVCIGTPQSIGLHTLVVWEWSPVTPGKVNRGTGPLVGPSQQRRFLGANQDRPITALSPAFKGLDPLRIYHV